MESKIKSKETSYTVTYDHPLRMHVASRLREERTCKYELMEPL